MAIKCPKCGSTNMVLIAQTDAHFEVDENGRMGDAILDQEGIDCINETVALADAADGDIEFKCRQCRSSFAAKTADREYTYEVGEEL